MKTLLCRLSIFIIFSAGFLLHCANANEMIAIGLSEKQVDSEAYRDIESYEQSIHCTFSENYPTVLYGKNTFLPSDERLIKLRQEYINLVYAIKEQKDLLNQDFNLEDWLPSDAENLYTTNEHNNAKKQFFETAKDRIKKDESDKKIESGIKLLLANIATNTISGSQPNKNNNKTVNNKKTGNTNTQKKEISPDKKQDKAPKKTEPNQQKNVAAKHNKANKTNSKQSEQNQVLVTQDSTEELCEEFPEEPECSE